MLDLIVSVPDHCLSFYSAVAITTIDAVAGCVYYYCYS